MMRSWIVFLVLAGGAGCADTHLGELYGRRARAVFDAQAQSGHPKSADAPGALDSEDARTTLARQRGRGLPGAPGVGQTPVGYGPGLGVGGASSTGLPSASPSGPIRLDAVR